MSRCTRCERVHRDTDGTPLRNPPENLTSDRITRQECATRRPNGRRSALNSSAGERQELWPSLGCSSSGSACGIGSSEDRSAGRCATISVGETTPLSRAAVLTVVLFDAVVHHNRFSDPLDHRRGIGDTPRWDSIHAYDRREPSPEPARNSPEYHLTTTARVPGRSRVIGHDMDPATIPSSGGIGHPTAGMGQAPEPSRIGRPRVKNT